MINVTRPDLPPLKKYVEYLEQIWSTRCLTNDGVYCQLLAKKITDYLKTKNLLLVTNGTLALQMAFKVLNLKGEVITTPFTFAATTNSLIWEGLTPVFADIDPETYNISPLDVEKKISSKTSAILAVHVYGNPCYVKELQEIADKHNLKLIFDSAHAFGVEYEHQSVMNYGDVSTLSFHATKVFSTIEGGALVVKDESVLEKLKLLRNHGIKSEEQIVYPGTNAKLNEFQAVMGLCNLEVLDEKILLRKRLYEQYTEMLQNVGGVNFQRILASRYNYSYMPVRFESMTKRDIIYSVLQKNGIKARKYFYPLTTDSAYLKCKVRLIEKFNLKNSFYVSKRILCLPLYPDLEPSAVASIVSVIQKKSPMLLISKKLTKVPSRISNEPLTGDLVR